MAFNVPGTPPVNSTAGRETDPSTSVLMAELDSTNLKSNRGGIYEVQIWLGCSTVGDFVFEHCTSTGLGSSAIVDQTFYRVSPNLTPQYRRKVDLGPGDRMRVRMATELTGSQTAEAKLQAEELDG